MHSKAPFPGGRPRGAPPPSPSSPLQRSDRARRGQSGNSPHSVLGLSPPSPGMPSVLRTRAWTLRPPPATRRRLRSSRRCSGTPPPWAPPDGDPLCAVPCARPRRCEAQRPVLTSCAPARPLLSPGLFGERRGFPDGGNRNKCHRFWPKLLNLRTAKTDVLEFKAKVKWIRLFKDIRSFVGRRGRWVCLRCYLSAGDFPRRQTEGRIPCASCARRPPHGPSSSPRSP